MVIRFAKALDENGRKLSFHLQRERQHRISTPFFLYPRADAVVGLAWTKYWDVYKDIYKVQLISTDTVLYTMFDTTSY